MSGREQLRQRHERFWYVTPKTGFSFVRGQRCKYAFCVLSAVVGSEANGESKEAMCRYQDSRFGAKI